MPRSFVRIYPSVDAGNGVTRRVLAESPELMVVEFRFAKNGAGALHNHPHVQATYVKSGVFEFTIGDEVVLVRGGDSFVIPSSVAHGCRALEEGVLIDTFTPRRDDFL
ncbi:cupin domain-containing protein [Ensifer sp. NBAIM29]|nr:cupin domain-containing protein [Ensifer sp. NBAIM29]